MIVFNMLICVLLSLLCRIAWEEYRLRGPTCETFLAPRRWNRIRRWKPGGRKRGRWSYVVPRLFLPWVDFWFSPPVPGETLNRWVSRPSVGRIVFIGKKRVSK